MHKNKRLITLTLATVLALSSIFTGCGNKATAPEEKKTTTMEAESTKPKEELKEVALSYYFPNTPQKDLESTNQELNKLLKEKINATVKLNLVDWSAWDQKMNVILSAGEEFDVCWSAAGSNFYQNVAKGAFKDIDGLLDQYGKGITEVVPSDFWKAVTVKSKKYAVVNFQQACAGFGYIAQKPLFDKYKVDIASLKKLEDLTPILAEIKKGEPTLIPFEYNKGEDPFVRAPILFGMEDIGDTKTPGWVYTNDDNLKVVNQYETVEFKNQITMMRDWYKKGYLRKDAATLKDTQADRKAGKNAVQFGQIDLGTSDWAKIGLPSKGRMFAFSGVESVDEKFIEPVLTTGKAAATLNCISATSKNPERAMMFLNLLNSDVQVYNTLCYGVENKHYKKTGTNTVEYIKDSGYQLWSWWEFGYMGNAWYDDSFPKGSEVDNKGHKAWIELNKNAKATPSLGFSFIADSVKTEIANCTNVIEELYSALASGSVDTDKYLPIFLNKLKAAGADKIIAEKQKQLDEWKATK